MPDIPAAYKLLEEFAKPYFHKYWTEIYHVTTIWKRNVCSFIVTLNALDVRPTCDTAIRPTKTFSCFFTWRWEQNTFLKSFGLYIRNQDDEWSPKNNHYHCIRSSSNKYNVVSIIKMFHELNVSDFIKS